MNSGLKVRSAWRERFLSLLEQGRTVTEASRMLNVGKAFINQEKKRDPFFAEQIQATKQASAGKKIDNW